MIHIHALWVGKTEGGFVGEGAAFYQKRIRPMAQLSLHEIKPQGHSGRPGETVRQMESDALLQRLGQVGKAYVVLLDERGKTPTSREMAEKMAKWAVEGEGQVVFVMGGAFGVDERVRQRANTVLGLSALTFPHQLVRVIFLEQIYRCLTIQAGHRYHHD